MPKLNPSPLDVTYFEAVRSRDYRFDGKFFVGVKTTGIYCRPICPAQPKRENMVFFQSSLEAERSGYRPCLRCRPESAPLSPAWIGKSAVVQRAIKMLNTEGFSELNEDDFADQFGVTARHLRRLFVEEIGKTPKQLFFENRLNLSRKLIIETALPITEVAFAAGFSSIRRFNFAFNNRFKKAPREIRRNKPIHENQLQLYLSYRPPFDYFGLLKSYEKHRMGNLEWFIDQTMHRVVSFDGKVGKIAISNDPENSRLVLRIEFPDTSVIHTLISRVRNLFDLDSDPLVVANSLEINPKLKVLLERFPGIRLPSGWDPFEIAVSTILGQLVSVDWMRILVGDLIQIAGKESGLVREGVPIKLFPTPQQMIQADLGPLRTTQARKQTLVEFSQAIVENRISLQPTQDVGQFLNKIQHIKGIGPWTADYIALKALRCPGTFPRGDLVLNRAVIQYSQEVIDTSRPWRGYLAALLWRAAGEKQS